jgi:hypothetical protein
MYNKYSRLTEIHRQQLPAAHGTIDDCLLVGMDVSDLSALAGAGAGTTDATL